MTKLTLPESVFMSLKTSLDAAKIHGATNANIILGGIEFVPDSTRVRSAELMARYEDATALVATCQAKRGNPLNNPSQELVTARLTKKHARQALADFIESQL